MIRALSTGANVAEAQIKSGTQYRTGEASGCKVQRQVQRKAGAQFRAGEVAGSGYWIKSSVRLGPSFVLGRQLALVTGLSPA